VASERDLSYREPRLPSYPPGGPTAVGRAPRPPHAPLSQRMRDGHWIAIDCVVAAFAALFVLVSVHQAFLDSNQMWLAIGLMMAAGVFFPVALRRRAPVMAFGGLLILAVLFGDMARGFMFPGAAITAVSLVFLSAAYVLYTVTVTSSRRTGGAALALALALLVFVGGTGRGRSEGAPAQLVPVGLASVIAWMTGYSVRQRRLYVVRLQQQAASSAVADERLRIARELHDVVAHSMSVIAVQAGYGQYVIDDSPDGAREALGAIQATSREALDEMRRMLGVLRQQDVTPIQSQADAWRANGGAEPGPATGAAGWPATGARFSGPEAVAASADGVLADAATGGSSGSGGSGGESARPLAGVTPGYDRGGSAPLAPAPGLANLDRLIKRTCGAGVRVSLEVYGNARPMPAGLDLSAYRIVQEALTNVVKHAGSGARCTVHLGYDEGVLAIRVTDDGGRSTTLPRYGGLSPAGPHGQAGQAGDDKVPAAVGATPGGDAAARAEAAPRSCADPTVDDGHRAGGVGAASPARNGHRTVSGWRVPSEPPASAGHGIIGMRERAHLCGGKFSARPLAEGGFQVTASLPLPAMPRAEATA
jgi:signal transduction histidine kinase